MDRWAESSGAQGAQGAQGSQGLQGPSTLSSITAATAANSIANGDNAQTWQWKLTTASKSAFAFGESAASTGGVGLQYILNIATLASSTAVPLVVSARGAQKFGVMRDGTVLVGDSYSDGAGVDFDVNLSKATAQGVVAEVFNRSTATHSNASVLVQANNGVVSGDWFCDGLGTSLFGVASMAVGSQTAHPFIMYSNLVETMRLPAAGGLLMAAGKALTVGTGGMVVASGAITASGTTSCDLSGGSGIQKTTTGAFTSGASSALFKNSANSTTAFQVQDSSANVALNVDTTNGRVGVGTAAPVYALDVKTTANVNIFANVQNSIGQLVFGCGDTGTPQGIVSVVNAYPLVLKTTNAARITIGAGAAAVQFNGYGVGAATFDASGNITSVSDARFKQDIRDYDGGLAEILALRPVTFRYAEHSGLDTHDVMAGFIAQEHEEILPCDVGVMNDGTDTRTFGDRELLCALVKSVQELTAMVVALTGEAVPKAAARKGDRPELLARIARARAVKKAEADHAVACQACDAERKVATEAFEQAVADVHAAHAAVAEAEHPDEDVKVVAMQKADDDKVGALVAAKAGLEQTLGLLTATQAQADAQKAAAIAVAELTMAQTLSAARAARAARPSSVVPAIVERLKKKGGSK